MVRFIFNTVVILMVAVVIIVGNVAHASRDGRVNTNNFEVVTNTNTDIDTSPIVDCLVDRDFYDEIVGFHGYADIHMLSEVLSFANGASYIEGRECFLTSGEYWALVAFSDGTMTIDEVLSIHPRFIDPVYGSETQLPWVDETFYW